MQVSERFLAEELDRIILSAILRIGQQSIQFAELTARPSEMAEAQSVLADMDPGLELMRVRRAP
jgi:hypothetical protein